MLDEKARLEIEMMRAAIRKNHELTKINPLPKGGGPVPPGYISPPAEQPKSPEQIMKERRAEAEKAKAEAQKAADAQKAEAEKAAAPPPAKAGETHPSLAEVIEGKYEYEGTKNKDAFNTLQAAKVAAARKKAKDGIAREPVPARGGGFYLRRKK